MYEDRDQTERNTCMRTKIRKRKRVKIKIITNIITRATYGRGLRQDYNRYVNENRCGKRTQEE